MRKTLLSAAVLIVSAAPAFAACDATCQRLCHEGGPEWRQCIKQWSVINATMGSQSYKCMYKVPIQTPVKQLTREYLDQICQ